MNQNNMNINNQNMMNPKIHNFNNPESNQNMNNQFFKIMILIIHFKIIT